LTFKERVLQGSEAGSHIVQLFDSTQSRASTIAAYVAEGLAAGDTVLIVAQSGHWKATAELIAPRRLDVNKAIQSGQLTVLNAGRTLKRFTVNGMPDPARFDLVVGSLVRRLAARRRPLRAYGEMVDLLAGEGDFASAQALEDLWNRLGATMPFTLFCGYSSAHFVSQRSASALELVCRCHTSVRTDRTDELAVWLLESHRPKAAQAS
jgi:hypothetical protein